MEFPSVHTFPISRPIGLLAFVVLLLAIIPKISWTNAKESTDDGSKPCTFFSSDRNSSPEYNLVNCSWYYGNACCRRTEVTSVFDGMYPLMMATVECQNRINYLMCYFCSPMQYLWYDRHANVCSSFCNSVYEHCHNALYNGHSIEENYSNGTEFCQGQHFSVVDGNHCFDFDGTVFSSCKRNISLVWLIVLVSLIAHFCISRKLKYH